MTHKEPTEDRDEAQPNLGLATTEQLIEELYARMDVNRTIGNRNLPLDYRTVDKAMTEPTEEELAKWESIPDFVTAWEVHRLIEALRTERVETMEMLAADAAEISSLKVRVAEFESLREWQRIALNVLRKVQRGYVEDIARWRDAEYQVGSFIAEAEAARIHEPSNEEGK